MRDLADYRSEFPVLDRTTYLISASLGPIGTPRAARIDGYLDAWASKGAPDLVWFEDIFPAMRDLKRTFAGLAGCDAGRARHHDEHLDRAVDRGVVPRPVGTAQPDRAVRAGLPHRRARLARAARRRARLAAQQPTA